MKEKIKWPLIKRILGTLLIVAGLVFILINYQACYNAHKTSPYPDPNQELVQLKPNSVVKQQFIGMDGQLKKIGIYMNNQGMDSATGSISVQIFHKDKMLCTDTVQANAVIHDKITWFRFLDRPDTEEGEIYTAVFTCENFKNDQGFGFYSSLVYNKNVPDPVEVDGKLSQNDKNARIKISFAYYDYKLFIKFAIILLIGIILIWLPYGRIEKFIKKKTNIDICILY